MAKLKCPANETEIGHSVDSRGYLARAWRMAFTSSATAVSANSN